MRRILLTCLATMGALLAAWAGARSDGWRSCTTFLATTGVLLAACESDLPPVASPPASPVATSPVIIPGAAFARDTVRVLPNGGFGTPVELQVELPQTDAAYQQGLMSRPPLPDTQGMLFVMAGMPRCSFWMKDTPSPLSIGFADSDGRIFNIQDMQPFVLDIHDPGRPCTYALEVAQGWFERQGVHVGDLLRFPWPPDQPPAYPSDR